MNPLQALILVTISPTSPDCRSLKADNTSVGVHYGLIAVKERVIGVDRMLPGNTVGGVW